MKRKRETSLVVVKERKSSVSSDSNESDEPKPKKLKTKSTNHDNNSKAEPNFNVRLRNTGMLTNYRNTNQHIQIESMKSTSNCTENDIDSDDEIWICEIPTSIDVNGLVGKSVKLGSKRCSIKTERTEIECVSSKFEDSAGAYENTLSVVFQNNNSQLSMKNIKPMGRLAIHEKVIDSEPQIELTPSDQHECTIYPDSLVVRHPLFGRHFKKEVNIKEEIRDKLAEASSLHSKFTNHVKVKQEKPDVDANSQKSRKADKSDEKSHKNKIKKSNGLDDDLDRIKQIFETN